MSVDLHAPVAQLMMFIVVVCNVMMGVSRRLGDFLLGLLTVTLRCAFLDNSTNLSLRQQSILSQIPRTMDTVLSKFNLDSKTTTYAVCPNCHCTYPPEFAHGSTVPSYPKECNNLPLAGSNPCRTQLLESSGDPPKPLKSYVYYHFHDYLAGLLAQKDLEKIMDQPCDDLMASINANDPPAAYVSDVFDAEFLRSFEGPISGHLFVDRPGNEGRYAFVLFFDFFRTEGMMVNGASTSCGILSAACLNLPLDIRYKPENMYLAGVVPGPAEPHSTQLNHYVRPIIDDFLASWTRGVHYSRTANHPAGRDTRSAVALGLGDLPAARQISASAGHSSHNYCTRCKCFHQSTLCRTDIHHDDWLPKDPKVQRQKAEDWKNAPTRIGQEKLFSVHGVRWSELWRLPYWDPARMLVVDTMHCLLEGLVEYHFRELLALTTVSANEKTPVLPAFNFELPLPDDDYISAEDLGPNDLNHISKIYDDLVAEILADSPIAQVEQFSKLTKRLGNRNIKALRYVSNTVKAEPSATSGRVGKINYAEGLANWVCPST
jgi:Transposase family tnp2